MSDYTQSYRKFILSFKFSSLCCALYKTSELAGLVKTDLTLR